MDDQSVRVVLSPGTSSQGVFRGTKTSQDSLVTFVLPSTSWKGLTGIPSTCNAERRVVRGHEGLRRRREDWKGSSTKSLSVEEILSLRFQTTFQISNGSSKRTHGTNNLRNLDVWERKEEGETYEGLKCVKCEGRRSWKGGPKDGSVR